MSFQERRRSDFNDLTTLVELVIIDATATDELTLITLRMSPYEFDKILKTQKELECAEPSIFKHRVMQFFKKKSYLFVIKLLNIYLFIQSFILH